MSTYPIERLIEEFDDEDLPLETAGLTGICSTASASCDCPISIAPTYTPVLYLLLIARAPLGGTGMFGTYPCYHALWFLCE